MEYDVSLYRSYTFELGTNGILKACIEGTALARVIRVVSEHEVELIISSRRKHVCFEIFMRIPSCAVNCIRGCQ